MTSSQLGNLGEEIALEFLKTKNYKILDRNYFKNFLSGPRIGEIDIIAVVKRDFLKFLLNRKESIRFIEVKTGKKEDEENFPPEERVNSKKKRKISKMAEIWLNEHKIPLNSKWQIDIISISIDFTTNSVEIKHFENI